MSIDVLSEYAGIKRQFDVGLRLAPTRAGAAAAAKSVASLLDAFPQVSVRLVGFTGEGSRVHITLAVCLGTVDAVKVAAPSSRAALALLQRLVDDFASCDPAFVQLPVDRDGRRTSMVGIDLHNLQTVG